jgi:hypothetical protein
MMGCSGAADLSMTPDLDARRIHAAATAQETWSGKVDQICRHLAEPVGFPRKGDAYETLA